MASAADSTSLYRRHRPGSFDEVVGQQHVVRTLRNAVEQGKVHHAYLFVGSRGTGKTSMAKILARSLNCEKGGPTVTPCGECESCISIAASTSVDVIEMDAASNRSVEDIRELRERVAYAPTGGRWKVYILDEAHMLTKEAWNAFLKTLEEPPPDTVFVLATTEAHRVMATIADRCQRFDFQRPSLEQISQVLQRVAAAEQIEVEEAAVSMIARSASGSFRDALGTLDQLVTFGGSGAAGGEGGSGKAKVTLEAVLEVLGAADAELLFETVDAVGANDPKGVLLGVEKLARSGRDPSQFARDLLGHLRHLLITQTLGEVPDTFVVTATDAGRLQAQAASIGAGTLVRTIDELATALIAVREGDDARMSLEIALLKAARPDLDPKSEGLLRRVERLEREAGIRAEEPALPASGSGPAGGSPATASPSPAAASLAQSGGAPSSAVPAETAPAPSAAAPPDAGAPQAPPASSAAPGGAAPASATGDPADATSGAPSPASATGDPAGGAAGEGGTAGSGAPGKSEAAASGASGETTPASGATSLDLEQLIRIWPAVLDHLRQATPALATTFEHARPVSFDTGERIVQIGFPADSTFNKRKAEAPERREQIAAALEAVAGERLRPIYVLLDGNEAPGAGVSEQLDEEALVERLKSEFNAEEVSGG